jgi:hypothetical protein
MDEAVPGLSNRDARGKTPEFVAVRMTVSHGQDVMYDLSMIQKLKDEVLQGA